MTAAATAAAILAIIWWVLTTLAGAYLVFESRRRIYGPDLTDILCNPRWLAYTGAAIVGASYLIWG